MARVQNNMFAYASLVVITTCLATPAFSQEKTQKQKPVPLTAWEAGRVTTTNDVITTGSAKARDRLDSATSTSSLPETEINKIAPRSFAELMRNIPGIRVEAAAGEGSNSYAVRGLPNSGEGSKYILLQEDGLPIVEFGDLNGLEPDYFTRVDLNIAQVEAIRGGSASTFSSNAPGGVINLISKTGEVEGGSVQVTSGMNYQQNRLDADYGGHLSDTMRFHIGGFYRRGEGPRRTGFTGFRGGQLKMNITKEFDAGYIRLYGKFLDDHSPFFTQVPVGVTGTNADPVFRNLAGFSIANDSLLSSQLGNRIGIDHTGQPSESSYRDGSHSVAKSAGFETQIKVADWTITDRFRFSEATNDLTALYPVVGATRDQITGAFGIPGATYTYATGPLSGKLYDPTRGNGLLAVTPSLRIKGQVNNITNDLRANRVWQVGGGALTASAGVYNSRQNFIRDARVITLVQDVVGNGNSALINVAAAGGLFPISQNGVLMYQAPGNTGSSRFVDTKFNIIAPYGSLNFNKGKVSIGASARYDRGKVNGMIEASRPSDTGCFDFNKDGVSVPGTAECQTALPGRVQPINYDYGYLSYSTGLNLRLSEPLAVFARYSRGGRGGAESVIFSPSLSATDGHLINKDAAYDPVRQAEAGVKYRKNGVTMNATGFYALTDETATQINTDANGNAQTQVIARSYKAYGLELEGSVRRGPFSLTASATYAKAKIAKAENPALAGNSPRHQPDLIYQVTPQYDAERFSIGANVVGVTRSYAQDVNQLRLPAYTTVGLFLQYRPVDRLEISINASNLFDTNAITETLEGSIPFNNIALARTLYGRTVSASGRVYF